MIPILTTLCVTPDPDHIANVSSILQLLEFIPQRRTIVVDEAPPDLLVHLAHAGHTLYLPGPGRPPRMFWILAAALLQIRPRPPWFATIEQDTAVSPDALARACAFAESAPMAIAALGLATRDITQKPERLFPPHLDTCRSDLEQQAIHSARWITPQAALWRTSAFLAADPFHVPPFDMCDIVICARLRRLGFSIYQFDNLPAHHHTYLTTRTRPTLTK